MSGNLSLDRWGVRDKCIVLKVRPEEAKRWHSHLRETAKNADTSSRTPPEKIAKVREMLINRESKNQIIRQAHVGVTTVDKIKRQLTREGVLQ